MSYEKNVNVLVDEAKELVATLKSIKNPDVQRLRDRVDAFISDADQRNARPRVGRVQVRRIPGSVLDYVNEHPFIAVLTAASVAWTLAHLSSATRNRVRPE